MPVLSEQEDVVKTVPQQAELLLRRLCCLKTEPKAAPHWTNPPPAISLAAAQLSYSSHSSYYSYPPRIGQPHHHQPVSNARHFLRLRD
jgi:hypothetical protein